MKVKENELEKKKQRLEAPTAFTTHVFPGSWRELFITILENEPSKTITLHGFVQILMISYNYFRIKRAKRCQEMVEEQIATYCENFPDVDLNGIQVTSYYLKKAYQPSIIALEGGEDENENEEVDFSFDIPTGYQSPIPPKITPFADSHYEEEARRNLEDFLIYFDSPSNPDPIHEVSLSFSNS